MKEIPLTSLLSALTARRALNLLLAFAGGAGGRISRRPLALGAPFVLSVEPTNLCDLQCPHCETGAGALTRPSGCIDMGLYRTILELNRDHLLYLLLYDQGEPLLHPHFPEMVRLAKKQGLCVVSSTNGQRLADKAYAREIAACGLDALIISADGLTQSTYEVYRRGGSLEKVQSGLACLREARLALGKRTPRLFLQFVVMRHNEHELAQLHAAAAQWGADHVLIKSLYLRSVDRAEEILPSADRYRRYRQLEGRWLRKEKSARPCQRLWYSSVIHWDGNVVPCCFDKDGSHLLGHASEPLKELFHGEPYRQFRRRQYSANAPQICQNCTDGLKIYPS